MICPKCGSEIPDGSTDCFICGEVFAAPKPAQQPQMSQGGYYQSPQPGGDFYGDPMQYPGETAVPKSSAPMGLIFGIIGLLIIIAVVVLISSGIFANKDGVYSTDQLKESFMQLVEQEGMNPADFENSIDFKCTFTIDKGNAVLYMASYYEGEMMEEEKYEGTISFMGSKCTVNFTDKSVGKLTGTYDKDTQSIAYDLSEEEQELFGVEVLTFVKTTE